MITIFKIFEKQRLPRKGDYIILNLSSSTQEMKEFTKNNIGKIISNRILTYESNKYVYKVEYDLLTNDDEKILVYLNPWKKRISIEYNQVKDIGQKINLL